MKQVCFFQMRCVIVALTVLVLFFTGSASAEHYDVYFLAGQSNAGGHGYVSDAYSWFSPQGDPGLVEFGKTEYLDEQPDAIFYHWRGGNPSVGRPTLWDARSDGWIPMKAGYDLYEYNSGNPTALGNVIVNHPFGAEVSFAKRMMELQPEHKVAVIKYSQGATALGTATSPGAWGPAAGRNYNITSYASAGHCYAGFMECADIALQELESQGDTYTICGMLWHQGESDAGLSTQVYKERLQEFITAIREDFALPKMPFMIGELIKTTAPNIRAAQVLVADETPVAEFVSSDGMIGDSTGIHFNTNGQLLFGERYAEMLVYGVVFQREILGYWKLDESTIAWNGSVYSPVIESTGKIVSGVLWGYGESESLAVNSGVINQSGFDGSTDRAYDFAVDVGISGVATNTDAVIPSTDDFSIRVRFKTDNYHSSQGHLFSNNNGQAGRANLYVNNGLVSWWVNAGPSITAATRIDDNQWHEVIVTRHGDVWNLYLDNSPAGSQTIACSVDQSVMWMIGRARGYGGDYEGLVGDVTVYNYAVDGRPDFNNDGNVNLKDFSLIAAWWLGNDCDACGGADITLDETVNYWDLIEFLNFWLD